MERIILKISIYLLSFLSFSSYAHGQSAGQGSSPTNYIQGEVIVKLKGGGFSTVGSSSSNRGGSSSADGKESSLQTEKEDHFQQKVKNEKGMSLKASFKEMGVYHYALKSGEKVEDAVRNLKADPDVEYAEPNYIFTKETVGGVNQSFSSEQVQQMNISAQQSALSGSSSGYLATGAHIQVPNSWPEVTSNSVPVVAIIDTGLDLTHAVFHNSGAVWTNSGEIPGNGIDDDHNGYIDDVHGWNYISDSGNMIDDDDHGTHVAGIILGMTENIYGSSVSASHIRIMPIKFLDGSGYGKTSDAISAIYYAVNNGATVINNSWGGPSYSAALHEVITYSYNHGVVFVAAAGNSGTNNDTQPMYPASYDVPNIISVAATTDSDDFAYFSNYGQNSVHLASPGVFILSTLPGGGFGTMSGTSMAAPFVTGMAALMKVQQPAILGYQVKEIILASTDVIVDNDGHPSLNAKVSSKGRMNAFQTIQNTKTAVVDGSQPSYSFSNADRGLASNIAAGGCGLVTKYASMSSGGGMTGGGTSGAPEAWSVFLVVGLLSLPVLLYNALRRRDPVQRRKHERFKMNSEVKVMIGDKEMIGSISTISQGGVQLNTSEMLEKGGIVTMSIRSPDGQEQIAVEGRVVWSEANKAYGVQFAQTTSAIREQISGWTKSLAKAS